MMSETGVAATPTSAGGALRFDWKTGRVQGISRTPLPELIHRAPTVHRECRRSALLRRSQRAEGFDTARSESQSVPVILGENEDALNAAAFLQHAGVEVRAIRPPTAPAGRARSRFSITIQVSDEQLIRLVPSVIAWRERTRQVIPIAAKRA
jgi:hypothetical protein